PTARPGFATRRGDGSDTRTRGKRSGPAVCNHPGPWHSPDEGVNAMATATKRKPRGKPERRISIADPDPNGPARVVRVEEGRKVDHYHVRPIPSDFGPAYEVRKLGEHGTEATYAVNLDPLGPACDCLGFSHHGHCRHVEGLTALRARKQL